MESLSSLAGMYTPIACKNWYTDLAVQRMEVLLKSWFKNDEKTLKDIERHRYVLSIGNSWHHGGSLVQPQIWNTVLESNNYVHFSQRLRSGSSTSHPPTPAELSELPKTHYETRIQYTVSYYRRSQYGDHLEFEHDVTYKEPVEFELATEPENLPALEEKKDVTAARHAASRRRTDKDGKARLQHTDSIGETILKIHSPYLLNVLKSIIECSAEMPEGDNEGLDAGVFKYPYRDLYHHLDELLRYKTATTGLRIRHSDQFNKMCDEHIDLLQKYLESQPTIPYKEARTRWGRKIPVTTFATFWMLMKPGSDVYVQERDGSLNMYVVDKVTGGIWEKDGKKFTTKYVVQLWRLILDQNYLWQFPRYLDVPVFDDEKPIKELPVFPVKFVDELDNGAFRQTLINRGKDYWRYGQKPSFLQFTGQGLKRGLKSASTWIRYNISRTNKR